MCPLLTYVVNASRPAPQPTPPHHLIHVMDESTHNVPPAPEASRRRRCKIRQDDEAASFSIRFDMDSVGWDGLRWSGVEAPAPCS